MAIMHMAIPGKGENGLCLLSPWSRISMLTTNNCLQIKPGLDFKSEGGVGIGKFGITMTSIYTSKYLENQVSVIQLFGRIREIGIIKKIIAKN